PARRGALADLGTLLGRRRPPPPDGGGVFRPDPPLGVLLRRGDRPRGGRRSIPRGRPGRDRVETRLLRQRARHPTRPGGPFPHRGESPAVAARIRPGPTY